MSKNKDGIYWRNGIVGIRYAIIGPDGKRHEKRESLGRGARERDAKALLRQRLGERDRGVVSSSASDTVAQYLATWRELTGSDRSPSTNERYEQIIRLQVNPVVGYLRLTKVQPLHIEAVLNEARKVGLARKTVKNIYTVLHTAFRQAVEWRLIPLNPADAVKTPRAPKPNPRDASDEDLARILIAIAESHHRVPIMLVITTGMRRGELCGLKWNDFDEKNGLLTIRRELLQTVSEGVQEATTKSERGRTLKLTSGMITELVEHRKQQGYNPEGWMFLSKRDRDKGKYLTPQSISKAYMRLRRSVGVDIVLHGLRHTLATRLILGGVDDNVVALILGHANPATTRFIYTHARVKDQAPALEIASELLNTKPKIRLVEG